MGRTAARPSPGSPSARRSPAFCSWSRWPFGGRRHGRSRPYTEGVLERKLATVLFVDLVGSTDFASRDDPEIVRRRVDAYFERTSRCIEQHGGTVEKFAGDAVMAAFGIPRAHEDDAERALRAAL